MTGFNTFDLPESLRHTLQHMNFDKPTPIQAQAIPPALEGKDIMGTAQTGTGKTAAFTIPIIAKLHANPKGLAIILVPTRELATQVATVVTQMLGKTSKIKTALLIGGDSMMKQLTQLRNNPRIIIGTPGRVNDHLDRKSLKLHEANTLVLDETDRMLDMGFGIQIDEVLKYMPQERQTMLFSATLPPQISKLSAKYLKSPVRISVSADNAVATKVKQELIKIQSADKYDRLMTELNARKGSVLVFVKTKHNAERMADKLEKSGYEADTIHGDLRQNKRDRVIQNFRAQNFRVLVATDIAARGLDIPHIETVVNFDLPQSPEDYVHRIGRTGRNGAEGVAVSFLSGDDNKRWREIVKLMSPKGGKAFAISESIHSAKTNKSSAPVREAALDEEEEAPREKYTRGGDDRRSGGREGRGGFGGERRGGGDRKFGGKPKFGGKSGGFGKKNSAGRPFREDAPARAEGAPREFKPRGDFQDRPKRSFGDRPQRSFNRDESAGERPTRKSFGFGDKPQSEGKKFYGDKPRRDFDGDRPARKSFGDKPRFNREGGASERPKRQFDGDRPARAFDGDRPARKTFGDKPRFNREEGGASERPKRAFGDKPRGDFRERRPEGAAGEGKPFVKPGFSKNGYGGNPNSGKSTGFKPKFGAGQKSAGAKFGSKKPSFGGGAPRKARSSEF
jgi:superfamily II DNA/RNA helicase